MSEVRSYEFLNKEIERLKLILELPKLYLADYFIDLRNRVDKNVVSKLANLQNDDEKKKKLNEIWQSMIQKIDSFERKCVRNSKIEMSKKNNERLSSIETILTKHEAKNLEDLYEEIETIEISILHQLFRNKTIAFVEISNICSGETRGLIDYKLIIINDQFIRDKSIEQKIQLLTNMFVNKTLDNEFVQLFTMINKFKQSKYIVEDILCLNDLHELDISFNRINQIKSNAFNGLKSLQSLNLTRNKLTRLNRNSFASLGDLKSLYLGVNLISDLNEHVFNGMNSLQLLDLHCNQITQLNANLLSSLNNLQTLNLNQNEINRISAEFFKGLVNLKELDMNQNRITEIDINAFNDLKNLETLNLSRNRIFSIDIDIFKNLNNLKHVDLHYNLLTGINKQNLEDYFKAIEIQLIKI